MRTSPTGFSYVTLTYCMYVFVSGSHSVWSRASKDVIQQSLPPTSSQLVGAVYVTSREHSGAAENDAVTVTSRPFTGSPFSMTVCGLPVMGAVAETKTPSPVPKRLR